MTSEPAARPKLNDICCIELAMVLAMLESAGSMSAKAIEFMLENCSELKKPSDTPSSTISSSGVEAPIKANRQIVTPIISVLTTSTLR